MLNYRSLTLLPVQHKQSDVHHAVIYASIIVINAKNPVYKLANRIILVNHNFANKMHQVLNLTYNSHKGYTFSLFF